MKKYTLLLLISLLFCASCKKEDVGIQLKGKLWKLDSFQVYDENKKEWTEVEAYTDVFVIRLTANKIIVNTLDGNTEYNYTNTTGSINTKIESKVYASSIDKLTENELVISGNFAPFLIEGFSWRLFYISE